MYGKHRWTIAASVALGMAFTAAPASAEGPVGPDGEADDTPRGTYIRVFDAPLVEDTNPQLGGAPHLLFLQRCEGGLNISPGNGGSVANQSGIIGGNISLPPFPFGDGAWNDVVDRTRNIFSPFNITVTDVDPGNTPHDEAVVCGAAGDAGFPQGVGGVAPFTCGIINNPITFTFPEALGNNPQLIAEVIGQEAAHAWGLDHEYLCQDPMTYLSGCGPKTFQDIDAQCGEFSPRACDCGGATQNSYQHILDAFGSAVPDTQAPTAAIVTPGDGDVFAPGASFEISVNVADDVQVAEVTLYVNGSPESVDDSNPFGPWPVTEIPEGTYEFYIDAEDTAGNVTTSSVVTVHVTADGEPPPPGGDDDGGGDGNGDGGGGDGAGDGGGDGAGDGGGDGGGGGADGGGALPPGYSTGFEPDDASASGCDCKTGGSPRGGIGFGLMLLGLLGLRAHGRRRRA
ncbi:MAG: hypothetical protein K0V04_18625 [Deltaproteobacteria bacterium]|nr:hypothetical protein [Deltaproteobacteria bacterium]